MACIITLLEKQDSDYLLLPTCPFFFNFVSEEFSRPFQNLYALFFGGFPIFHEAIVNLDNLVFLNMWVVSRCVCVCVCVIHLCPEIWDTPCYTVSFYVYSGLLCIFFSIPPLYLCTGLYHGFYHRDWWCVLLLVGGEPPVIVFSCLVFMFVFPYELQYEIA